MQNLNNNPNFFSVKKANFFRPRTLYYLVIISIICTAIIFGLVTKKPISVSVLQERNPLYVLLSDGSIRNTYQLNITNKSHQIKKLTLTTSHSDIIDLKILNQNNNLLELKPQALSEFKIFLTTKNKIINTESLVIDFILTDNQETYQTSAVLFFP